MNSRNFLYLKVVAFVVGLKRYGLDLLSDLSDATREIAIIVIDIIAAFPATSFGIIDVTFDILYLSSLMVECIIFFTLYFKQNYLSDSFNRLHVFT